MSVWLDSSSNSNKFKQSYFRDFVDISGDILVRNGLSLKLYNNNIPTRVQFSVNSKEFHIYNETNQTYYDISNTKLIHLQDLSENVQSKLNLFTDRTKYIATDVSNSETMIEFNKSQNLVKIYNQLDVSSNIIGRTDLSINRNASIGGNATFTGNIAVSGDVSFNSKLFVSNTITISGDIIPQTASQSNLGSVDKPFKSLFVSNNTIHLIGTDSNTGNKTVTGISVENGKMKITNPSGTEQDVNVTLNNKTGFGKDSSIANATIDVSGTAIISGDVSLNRKLYVGGDASFSGRVDVCGNFYAKYPQSSIPASAINLATDISVNSVTVGRGSGNDEYNTAIGYRALASNTTGGAYNTAVGYQALSSTTSGNFNTAVGTSALQNNTSGAFNVAVGTSALVANTTGNYNIALNWGALLANTIGNDNIALGKQALNVNQTGSNNIAIGTLALQNSTSSNSSAIGWSALQSSTGTANTAFGYLAGGSNTTGEYNTFIGYGSDTSGTSFSNSTAIGWNAKITASNQLALGTSTETVYIPGKLSVVRDLSLIGNLLVSKDVSFNSKLFVGGNTTMNSKLAVAGDASFSGRVDICGNFWAQYPPNSIPASAIIGGVGGGGGGGEVSQLSSFGTNITFDNNFALIKEAVVDPMSMLLRQFQF